MRRTLLDINNGKTARWFLQRGATQIFDTDGQPLNAPAISPLQPVEDTTSEEQKQPMEHF
jgi:hypothetical protein